MVKKIKIILYGQRQVYNLHKTEEIYMHIAKEIESNFDS